MNQTYPRLSIQGAERFGTSSMFSGCYKSYSFAIYTSSRCTGVVSKRNYLTSDKAHAAGLRMLKNLQELAKT